jgi:sec-independent protein translocase protein TatC
MTTTTETDNPWQVAAEVRELGDHLEDLRSALIKSLCAIAIAFIVCFLFHQTLIDTLQHPFAAARPQENFKIISQTSTELTLERTGPTLMILGPLEGISIALKISLWGGLALSAPFWGFFLLQFMIPGLHSHERNMIVPFTILSLLAMAAGAVFGFLVVLPLSNAFLMEFNRSLGMNFWSLEQSIDYTIVLILANMIAFELIAVLLLLTHFGWISAEQLIRQRKKAIVVALIIGAVLTPPDVLTQILLAIPLIGGYELAILYANRKAVDVYGIVN